MSDEDRRERAAAKKRKLMENPEYRAREAARQRAARAKAKRGPSWPEAKRTGPTLVPGTYALEET